MARRGSSARRYAEAAFGIAERDGTVDGWLEQLAAGAERLGDERAMRILEDPRVPLERRAGLIDEALDMPPPVRNLVQLLLRRGRVDLLPGVAREFRRLHHERLGITGAIVTSAAPLDTDEARALTRRLEEMTTGRVELDFRVDPALLGGVVVRLGDQLFDGSLRGRLERLRHQLASGAL